MSSVPHSDVAAGAGAKAAKAPKGKRGKDATAKGAKGQDAGGAETVPSVANHPRARQSVRQAKALVGLAAFLIALWLSTRADVPLAMAAERALLAGVAGWLIAWGCAVTVWRALLAAELRARVDALTAERDAATSA